MVKWSLTITWPKGKVTSWDKSLKASHYPTELGTHRQCGGGDIVVLVGQESEKRNDVTSTCK